MDDLRQPTTPLGVVNETFDETVIINENSQEDDYHSQCTKHGLTDTFVASVYSIFNTFSGYSKPQTRSHAILHVLSI